MTIEEELQNYITSRYSSVTQFCVAHNMASSTIFTVFKRGINNSSSTTIIKICRALRINTQALYNGEIKSETEYNEEQPIDIIQYLYDIEKLKLTYKGIELSEHQKRMIAYASKVALMTIAQEDEIDNREVI